MILTRTALLRLLLATMVAVTHVSFAAAKDGGESSGSGGSSGSGSSSGHGSGGDRSGDDHSGRGGGDRGGEGNGKDKGNEGGFHDGAVFYARLRRGSAGKNSTLRVGKMNVIHTQ